MLWVVVTYVFEVTCFGSLNHTGFCSNNEILKRKYNVMNNKSTNIGL